MNRFPVHDDAIILLDDDDDEDNGVVRLSDPPPVRLLGPPPPPPPRSTIPTSALRSAPSPRAAEAEMKREAPHARSNAREQGGPRRPSIPASCVIVPSGLDRSSTSSPSSSSSSSSPSASTRRPPVAPLAAPSPPKDLDYDPAFLTLYWQGEEDSPAGSDEMRIDRPSSFLYTNLERNIRDAFHIPGLPIYLSDYDQRPVDSSTWQTRDYPRLSALLVHLEEHRPLYRAWKKELEHIPHPDLATNAPEYIQAGGEGHPVLAYALCEFIDNALSAFRARRERVPHFQGRIEVHFIEPTDQWAHTKVMDVIITDNGGGMDQKTLSAFARMVSHQPPPPHSRCTLRTAPCLTVPLSPPAVLRVQADAPDNRGVVRGSVLSDESNHYVNCSISQYGIGAKAAAFYLGQALSVSSYTGEPHARVYELTLSQDAMKSRYEATGNAYRSQLTARPVCQPAQCAWLREGREQQRHSDAIERVIREGILEEREGTPFTRLRISGMRSDLFKDVRERMDVVETLADVYDRHLHGPYGQGADNAELNARSTYHSPIIALRYTNQGHEKWKVDDLRTVRSNPQSHYSKDHKVSAHTPLLSLQHSRYTVRR